MGILSYCYNVIEAKEVSDYSECNEKMDEQPPVM